MQLIKDFIHITDREFFIKYWWQILIFAGLLFAILFGIESIIKFRRNHK
jgi:hypothetical protein|nr:MAG TPA: TMEM119 family [Caudoviricetes sp.]